MVSSTKSSRAVRQASPAAMVKSRRVALVDCDLSMGGFENIEFSEPDSLLGYDIVVIHITNAFLSYVYESKHDDYNGLPNFDAHVSSRIIADSQRRKTELLTLLDEGATVAFLIAGNIQAFVDTGKRKHSGTGRNRQTEIMIESFDLWDATLPTLVNRTVGRGKAITFNDHAAGHPLRQLSGSLVHEAVLEEDNLKSLAHITGTTKSVAAFRQVDRGHVLLLPRIKDEKEFENDQQWLAECALLVNAVIEIDSRLRPGPSDELPDWAFNIVTAAELTQEALLKKASTKLHAVQTSIDKINQRLHAVRRPKLLLSSTGTTLELIVKHVLDRFGIEVEMRNDNRTDLILKFNGHVAVAEVKGLTGSAAEKHAAQLEKWVSLYHEETNIEPKGILIVNHFREQSILSRDLTPFPTQMLDYVRRKELALITTDVAP